MAFSPSDSAIRVTPEVEAHLETLVSADEIKSYLARVAVDQNLCTRDRFSPDVLIPVEPGTTAKRFAQTVEVVGVGKKIFEGDSELDVTRQVNDFLRTQFSQPATPQTEQPRGNDGRFVSAEEAQADLRLRIMRGETTIDQAVGEYLQAQGIPIEDLQATVQAKANQRVAQSWEAATEEFLKTAGQDWPGGPRNLALMSDVLTKMDCIDEPSVENLAAAYKWLKDNNRLVANEEVELQKRIESAKSPEELRAALGRGSSSLFGR
jgi:hypothetical protein